MYQTGYFATGIYATGYYMRGAVAAVVPDDGSGSGRGQGAQFHQRIRAIVKDDEEVLAAVIAAFLKVIGK